MSINDQVKEEVQRQIDIAIEEIPYEKKRWSNSTAKLRLQYKNISDFLLALNMGVFRRMVFGITAALINKRRSGAAGEEAKRVTKEIDSRYSIDFQKFDEQY